MTIFDKKNPSTECKIKVLYQLGKTQKLKFLIQVRLSPSKKHCVVCLIKSPLKMMKNVFHFILKVLFVLKIFEFLSRLFGHVRKTA